MRRCIERFLSDQSGATAIEYAMIAVGVAVVIVTAVQGVGSTVKGSYVLVQTALK